MQVVELSRVWPGSNRYDIQPAVKDCDQVSENLEGRSGFDAVWIKISEITNRGLDGVVIDGPGRGSTVRFRRRDVWRVL